MKGTLRFLVCVCFTSVIVMLASGFVEFWLPLNDARGWIGKIFVSSILVAIASGFSIAIHDAMLRIEISRRTLERLESLKETPQNKDRSPAE